MAYIIQNTGKACKTHILHIKGLIQGVGFRPFIYRIARELDLNGFVYNQNDGVIVNIQGNKEKLNQFKHKIKTEAPAASTIIDIEETTTRKEKYHSFEIKKSKTVNNSTTLVSPDIAVCKDCLADMEKQKHRTGYPFINCTNCGPRFSIIEDIPYDRPFTSMKTFKMCPECDHEYNDIKNRRFHAQPIACHNCGPTYTLHYNKETISGVEIILSKLQEIINDGGTIAMKGLGGFHLACNAFNPEAIKKLRKIKTRDSKPFALMFKDIETLKMYTNLSFNEEQTLTSWRRPILLVRMKKKHVFPKEISTNLNTLGAFLPYLPLHYQLFKKPAIKALVMTSGNISDTPIIINNEDALFQFRGKVDAVLTHNRDIVNRVDDSVVQEDVKGIQIIRRARGYTPSPLITNVEAEGILATGAELSNAFCIGKGNQAILSQYIGDLKNLETMNFFENSLSTLKKLFKFEPQLVACDLHPDYLSTRFAEQLKIPVTYVQHHHAHIASVMAEHKLNEPVIGISYDGTGYGTDGKIWGSEIMVADYSGFERKYHFEYIPVPGGDKVAKEPWRSSVSYLHKSFKNNLPELEFLNHIPRQRVDLLLQALSANINTPESCSAGRLFDAVAGLTGICTTAGYHAEAPISLEHALTEGISESYTVNLQPIISWKRCIREIVNDVNNGVLPGTISAKFHNTVAQVTANAAFSVSQVTGIKKVVLSGGTFQNRYLTKKVVDLLESMNLEILISREIPCNDGGIAIGQLAVAAFKKNHN